MHKIAVEGKFTKISTKTGIKIHSEVAISSMYKQYTPLENVKMMGALNPESLTK